MQEVSQRREQEVRNQITDPRAREMVLQVIENAREHKMVQWREPRRRPQRGQAEEAEQKNWRNELKRAYSVDKVRYKRAIPHHLLLVMANTHPLPPHNQDILRLVRDVVAAAPWARARGPRVPPVCRRVEEGAD